MRDGCGGSKPRLLPALKLVLEKVKKRFLHHVCHLEGRTAEVRQCVEAQSDHPLLSSPHSL